MDLDDLIPVERENNVSKSIVSVNGSRNKLATSSKIMNNNLRLRATPFKLNL